MLRISIPQMFNSYLLYWEAQRKFDKIDNLHIFQILKYILHLIVSSSISSFWNNKYPPIFPPMFFKSSNWKLHLGIIKLLFRLHYIINSNITFLPFKKKKNTRQIRAQCFNLYSIKRSKILISFSYRISANNWQRREYLWMQRYTKGFFSYGDYRRAEGVARTCVQLSRRDASL